MCCTEEYWDIKKSYWTKIICASIGVLLVLYIIRGVLIYIVELQTPQDLQIDYRPVKASR